MRPSTDVDPETLSVMLCHLHPHVNNYNDLVLFSLQCNMDVKHIRSGPGAKALVFYVTDYIMKNGLSVHVGLNAIKYTIQNNERTTSFVDEAAKDHSLFVKSVNTLMAWQELSHQQVMSYLVSSGDHYKSHCFISILWDRLHCLFLAPSADNDEEYASLTESVSIQRDAMVTHDIINDYHYQPSIEPFQSMSLWSFAEMVEITSLTTEQCRMRDTEDRHCACGLDAPLRGRPAMPRGEFSVGHPL